MKQILLPVLIALCTSACVPNDGGSSEMKLETQQIDLGRAESVKATIEMPAGNFELRGGAAKLLEGEYRFSSEALRPVLDYRVSGGVGELKLSVEHKVNVGSAQARWETRLNDKVPLDLELRLGAGKAEALAGSLNLRRLEVNYGAGEFTLDLRGNTQSSYDAEIRGGVGLSRIYLPGDAGVEAEAHKGIGSISTQGDIRHDGSRYYNALWGKASKQVRLRIHGGIGTIKLIAED